MRSDLHRTFKTSNPRLDQTEERKQLALVYYLTENENREVNQNALKSPVAKRAVTETRFCYSNAACCIFVHSNPEHFNCNWNGDRIASSILRRCLYIASTCSVLPSNLSTACVLFSGTATPASKVNFSDTCSFSPKLNESLTCFAISYSEHVFVEHLCAITNAAITLTWRARSVYAHLKKPTIFTVHCRPD